MAASHLTQAKGQGWRTSSAIREDAQKHYPNFFRKPPFLWEEKLYSLSGNAS
jgi:hypothetical protein